MQIYSYYLGLFPLDWEFCFLSVDEYKEIIAKKYKENEMFYIEAAGEISEVYSRIDEILDSALKDWKQQFGSHGKLRCPPMIFSLPKGDKSNGADFCIILKLDDDGDTVVYSPIPLPYLEDSERIL